MAVIDVGLPGLNGYEVARRFREEPDSSAVVLVALTGYGTPEAQGWRSRKSGFNYHLIKPANGEALEEIMREAASARKRAVDAATTVVSPAGRRSRPTPRCGTAGLATAAAVTSS